MTQQFLGKVIALTGAASGIGVPLNVDELYFVM
jgi:hypothetical protein